MAEDDMDIESAMNLPAEEEILTIIEKAFTECLYEPYILL